jgi:4-diphosphocytidyl-2-C-methyl-D-erythritol kinase
MLKILAPAKLNLTLEVLGKRPDGFHEINSVLQTVGLYDIFYFESSRTTSIKCDMPGWSAEKSLITRAIDLLRETTGSLLGVKLRLEKHIPLMSGLGGDSSGAAAVLRGLNGLWGLGLSREERLGLAERLGSDVAFFLTEGTALAEGRGEKITSLPPIPDFWVVLVVPDVPRETGKTGRLYASLKPMHYTDGSITAKLVETLHKDKQFNPSLLFNTFENIAFDIYSGLSVYKEHLVKLGARHVHLAGSGPALFTMFSDKAEAEDLYNLCKKQGMEAYLVESV